jgi:hypothetical protein
VFGAAAWGERAAGGWGEEVVEVEGGEVEGRVGGYSRWVGIGGAQEEGWGEKKDRAVCSWRRVLLWSVDEHRYLLQRHARKIKARVFAREYCSFLLGCGLRGGRYGVGGGVGIWGGGEDGVGVIGGAVYNGGALVSPALEIARIEDYAIGPARPQ